MDSCLVRNKSGSLWRLAGLLGAALLAGSARAAFEPGPWGLYPGGVEQGDPRLCGAPAGNRCWYVDADVPADEADESDGSFERPFRSFERVAGYGGDSNFQKGVNWADCGDHILVKGIFRVRDNQESTRKMNIEFLRACGGPNQDRPLVIKSWPGEPRAIFEGNITDADPNKQNLIHIKRVRSVRIENVEVRYAYNNGIVIDDLVEQAEIKGVEVHHTRNRGGDGIFGGLALLTRSARHTYIVRNSHFHHNHETYNCDPAVSSCEYKNIAGVIIVGENPGQASNGSTVEVHDNVFHDEMYGITHKHTANAAFFAHHNLMYNVAAGFLLRLKENSVHHNIVSHSRLGVYSYPHAMKYDVTAEIHNNTFYNCLRLFQSTDNETQGWVYSQTFGIQNNIFHNNDFGPTDDVYFLATESNFGGVPLSGWTLGPNLYFYESLDTNTFVSHARYQNLNRSNGLVYLASQSGSPVDAVFQDPLFENPSAIARPPLATAAAVAQTVAALQLRENSPARGRGTGGSDMGALPYGGSPAIPARPRRLRIR